MTEDPSTYVFDSSEECERLERQAALQGIDRLTRHFQVMPGQRFLDAGSGFGALSRAVATRYPAAEVVGVELNPKYVAYARERAKSKALINTSYETGSVTVLPLEDASFDIVWSQSVLLYLPDPTAAIREFRRVIKPRGNLVVALRHRTLMTNYPEDHDLQERIEKVVPALVDPSLAKKMAVLLRAEGFEKIDVQIEVDPVFTMIGAASASQRQNVLDILGAGMSRIAAVLGTQLKAEAFLSDLVDYLDRPDTSTYTTLWVTTGVAPKE